MMSTKPKKLTKKNQNEVDSMKRFMACTPAEKKKLIEADWDRRPEGIDGIKLLEEILSRPEPIPHA